MLKVSVTEDEDHLLLDVEGRLAGPWVSELEHCWESQREHVVKKPIEVRLRAVSFIDDGGKELLTRMFAGGTKLEGNGCLVRAILAKITGKG